METKKARIRRRDVVLDEENGCHICWRKASGIFYGAFCCSACKMFFHRSIKQNMSYKCRMGNRCFERFTTLPNCQSCRLNKCWKVGMRPNPERLPVPEATIYDLNKLLENLTDMEEDRFQTMIRTYSTQNPTLDDLMTDRSRMQLLPKTPDVEVGPHEWAFLDVYSRFVYFSRFDFFQELRSIDQKRLFTFNYLRVGLLSGAMRTYKDKRGKLLTPDGQDVYPKAVYKLFDEEADNNVLERICSLLVASLIELRVTNEECQLLILIFFCDPTPTCLSEEAKRVLTKHRNKYSSYLYNYTLLKRRGYGPSRFTDLLSLCHVMHRVSNDLQFVSMMFQIKVGDFPFKNLVDETFVKAGINHGNVREVPDLKTEDHRPNVEC